MARKKTVRSIRGAKLLHPNGSLMFCENCEQLVGSINERGYDYINLLFICTCGNCGSVEIIKGGHAVDITNYVHKMPRSKNGNCRCTSCGTSMFSVASERVRNYSFYTQCVCGELYDTKPNFETRLGETLKLFKKTKER